MMEFILLSYEKKRTEEELWEDIQEWLTTVLEKKKEKCTAASSAPIMKRSDKTNRTDKQFAPHQQSLRIPRDPLQNQPTQRSCENKNLLDRRFVKQLQNRLRKQQEVETFKRIQQRQIDELQREKLLILNGKMAVEDAPVELANHPVFKIALETNKTLKQKRLMAEEIINKSFISMNTRMLRRLARENKKRERCQNKLHLSRRENKRLNRLQKIKEDLESGNIFTREDYERIWYESPLIKQFKTIETTDELFKQADVLVGRFERIPTVSELARQETCL